MYKYKCELLVKVKFKHWKIIISDYVWLMKDTRSVMVDEIYIFGLGVLLWNVFYDNNRG